MTSILYALVIVSFHSGVARLDHVIQYQDQMACLTAAFDVKSAHLSDMVSCIPLENGDQRAR